MYQLPGGSDSGPSLATQGTPPCHRHQPHHPFRLATGSSSTTTTTTNTNTDTPLTTGAKREQSTMADQCYLRGALRPSLDRCASSSSSASERLDAQRHLRRRLQRLATPPPHPHPHAPDNRASAYPWNDQRDAMPPAPRMPPRVELQRNPSSMSHLGRLVAKGRPPRVLHLDGEEKSTKRKAEVEHGSSIRAKRCRHQLRAAASQPAGSTAAALRIGNGRPRLSLVKRTVETPRRKSPRHAPGSRIQPISLASWRDRPMQHRRASSESCITLEETADRSRSSVQQLARRRPSLRSSDDINHQYRCAPPFAQALYDAPPSLYVTPRPPHVNGVDDAGDDPLPQLSLLSATQTAPVGWQRPTATFVPAASVSALQPEQQRFWPLVDRQLDWTAARMLSTAMAFVGQGGRARAGDHPVRVEDRSANKSTNLGDAPLRGGPLPAESKGASKIQAAPAGPTTLGSVGKPSSIHPPAALPTKTDDAERRIPPPASPVSSSASSCSGTPEKPDDTNPSGSQASIFENGCGAVGATRPLASTSELSPTGTGPTSGSGACPPITSPSATLAHVVAFTRRQAEARLRQTGLYADMDRSSSSESEGDCTPRQWRFNSIVARGRDSAAAGPALRHSHEIVATPDSEGGEPIGAATVLSDGKIRGKGWRIQSDYFGDWDKVARKRRVV
ncbi:hypothetical protein ACQY0O_007489 [Thecaphora frezii]